MYSKRSGFGATSNNATTNDGRSSLPFCDTNSNAAATMTMVLQTPQTLAARATLVRFFRMLSARREGAQLFLNHLHKQIQLQQSAAGQPQPQQQQQQHQSESNHNTAWSFARWLRTARLWSVAVQYIQQDVFLRRQRRPQEGVSERGDAMSSSSLLKLLFDGLQFLSTLPVLTTIIRNGSREMDKASQDHASTEDNKEEEEEFAEGGTTLSRFLIQCFRLLDASYEDRYALPVATAATTAAAAGKAAPLNMPRVGGAQLLIVLKTILRAAVLNTNDSLRRNEEGGSDVSRTSVNALEWAIERVADRSMLWRLVMKHPCCVMIVGGTHATAGGSRGGETRNISTTSANQIPARQHLTASLFEVLVRNIANVFAKYATTNKAPPPQQQQVPQPDHPAPLVGVPPAATLMKEMTVMRVLFHALEWVVLSSSNKDEEHEKKKKTDVRSKESSRLTLGFERACLVQFVVVPATDGTSKMKRNIGIPPNNNATWVVELAKRRTPPPAPAQSIQAALSPSATDAVVADGLYLIGILFDALWTIPHFTLRSVTASSSGLNAPSSSSSSTPSLSVPPPVDGYRGACELFLPLGLTYETVSQWASGGTSASAAAAVGSGASVRDAEASAKHRRLLARRLRFWCSITNQEPYATAIVRWYGIEEQQVTSSGNNNHHHLSASSDAVSRAQWLLTQRRKCLPSLHIRKVVYGNLVAGLACLRDVSLHLPSPLLPLSSAATASSPESEIWLHNNAATAALAAQLFLWFWQHLFPSCFAEPSTEQQQPSKQASPSSSSSSLPRLAIAPLVSPVAEAWVKQFAFETTSLLQWSFLWRRGPLLAALTQPPTTTTASNLAAGSMQQGAEQGEEDNEGIVSFFSRLLFDRSSSSSSSPASKVEKKNKSSASSGSSSAAKKTATIWPVCPPPRTYFQKPSDEELGRDVARQSVDAMRLRLMALEAAFGPATASGAAAAAARFPAEEDDIRLPHSSSGKFSFMSRDHDTEEWTYAAALLVLIHRFMHPHVALSTMIGSPIASLAVCISGCHSRGSPSTTTAPMVHRYWQHAAQELPALLDATVYGGLSNDVLQKNDNTARSGASRSHTTGSCYVLSLMALQRIVFRVAVVTAAVAGMVSHMLLVTGDDDMKQYHAPFPLAVLAQYAQFLNMLFYRILRRLQPPPTQHGTALPSSSYFPASSLVLIPSGNAGSASSSFSSSTSVMIADAVAVDTFVVHSLREDLFGLRAALSQLLRRLVDRTVRMPELIPQNIRAEASARAAKKGNAAGHVENDAIAAFGLFWNVFGLTRAKDRDALTEASYIEAGFLARTTTSAPAAADGGSPSVATSLLFLMPQATPLLLRIQCLRAFFTEDKKAVGRQGAERGRNHRGAAPVKVGLRIRRASVLDDALEQLTAATRNPTFVVSSSSHATPQLASSSPNTHTGCLDCYRLQWHVEFINVHGQAEAGIDAGGVFKEFLEVAIKEGFHPNTGLFIPLSSVAGDDDDQSVTPTPSSSSAAAASGSGNNVMHRLVPNPHASTLFPTKEACLSYYRLLGRLVAKAIYEGMVLPVFFAPTFLNNVLQRGNTYDDLKAIDAQRHASLQKLKHMDDVSMACLYFCVEEEGFGVRRTVDLIPGGRDVPVTNDNVVQYLHLLTHYELNLRSKDQTDAFALGFFEVCPRMVFTSLFQSHELQQLIAGTRGLALDVNDLKKHARILGGGLEADCKTLLLLWEVLAEMSVEDQGRFLLFCTGSSRPPLLGFATMDPPFSIRGVSEGTASVLNLFVDVDRLPSASTCFNLLKLPLYRSKSNLKAKLLQAIRSGSGFDLS